MRTIYYPAGVKKAWNNRYCDASECSPEARKRLKGLRHWEELYHLLALPNTLSEMNEALEEYVVFYNHHRPPAGIGYRSVANSCTHGVCFRS